MAFKPATRQAVKIRMALMGPSGSGKTFTALTFAHALGKKIAYVDTERGSASTYVGVNGWHFDVDEPARFDPAELARTLREAGTAGYDVVIVDSLTHYWSGPGGMLELSEKLQQGNNKFSGWAKANERERDMLDALLGFPGHVIVTLRTKNERVITQDDKSRAKVTELVLKPVQRDGIEYEFGVVAEMDQHNALTITKSRFAAVTVGEQLERPGAEFVKAIAEYLGQGESLPEPQQFADDAVTLSQTEGADLAEMRALLDRVHRAGYDQAGVKDPAGDTVALRDFIIECGSAMRATAGA